MINMISAFPPRASLSSQLFAFLSKQPVERLATTNTAQELSPESMAKICSPVQALCEANVDPLPSFQASGLVNLCQPEGPMGHHRVVHAHLGTAAPTLHCSDMTDNMPTAESSSDPR